MQFKRNSPSNSVAIQGRWRAELCNKKHAMEQPFQSLLAFCSAMMCWLQSMQGATGETPGDATATIISDIRALIKEAEGDTALTLTENKLQAIKAIFVGMCKAH